LKRKELECIIKDFLLNFHDVSTNSVKRGVYVYGTPGCGKTQFVINLLNNLNYDIIRYNAGDVKNKKIIESLLKFNVSDTNVSSYFKGKKQKMVIVMDEIDSLNSDKSIIQNLIKLIRQKKTQKQKKEGYTQVPIICIGNNDVEKKNKELMKVCILCELKSPTNEQMNEIVKIICDKFNININDDLYNKLINFINNDMRKLNYIINFFMKNKNNTNECVINNLLSLPTNNDNVKNLIKKLYNNNYKITEHIKLINDTDRTTVGLLWHENIIDVILDQKKENGIKVYYKILNNICFADYIDRITFQKQIWQFNEISSLIKTFYNNYIIHNEFNITNNNKEIRFTKVLTKYSTEFNNSVFIHNICQELNIDRNDMLGYFLFLKKNKTITEIEEELEYSNITILDINRIFRYIETLIEP
jgi:DNA polymerase III delta prime subunit